MKQLRAESELGWATAQIFHIDNIVSQQSSSQFPQKHGPALRRCLPSPTAPTWDLSRCPPSVARRRAGAGRGRRSTSAGTGRARTISSGRSEGMPSCQSEERNTPGLSAPSSPPSTSRISRSVRLTSVLSVLSRDFFTEILFR